MLERRLALPVEPEALPTAPDEVTIAIAPNLNDAAEVQYIGEVVAADGYLDLAMMRVPAGRMGDPTELAATLVWLVSPAGAYVVGQTIAVDGGITIT